MGEAKRRKQLGLDYANNPNRLIHFGDLCNHFYQNHGKGAFVYRVNQTLVYATREYFDGFKWDQYQIDINDYSKFVLVYFVFPEQDEFAAFYRFPITDCPLTIETTLKNIDKLLEKSFCFLLTKKRISNYV